MTGRTQRETIIYDQEYFSGSQVNLYIGDVLIDEANALSISVHQRKRPIYGYASQLFDRVARGTVLVEGQFQINFKESGYLYAVLNRHRALHQNNTSRIARSPFIPATEVGVEGGGARRDGVRGFLDRRNIEAILQDELGGQPLSPEQRIQYWQELAGYASYAGALGFTESVFKEFEDAIWSPTGTIGQVRRVDEEVLNNFTIYITYGDYNRNDRVNHTARRIDNVHLIGQAQEITINGQPIAEVYSFIARDFV